MTAEICVFESVSFMLQIRLDRNLLSVSVQNTENFKYYKKGFDIQIPFLG